MNGLAEALKHAAPESGGPGALQLIDAKRDELEAAADAAEAEQILKAAPLEGITQQNKDALIAALHKFATRANTQSGAPSTDGNIPEVAEPDASGPSGTGTPGASTSTSTISVEASRTSNALIAYVQDLGAFRNTVHSLIPTYFLPTTREALPSDQHASREHLFGKYVSLYQILGRSSNIEYSGMATIGINALQAGRIEMADTIYEIIRYNTSSSAALVAVMRGVWRFARYFFLFFTLIFSILYIVPYFVQGA
jgi:hypothetical protein